MQKQFNEKNQKQKNVEAQERWSVISEVKKERCQLKLSIYPITIYLLYLAVSLFSVFSFFAYTIKIFFCI